MIGCARCQAQTKWMVQVVNMMYTPHQFEYLCFRCFMLEIDLDLDN